MIWYSSGSYSRSASWMITSGAVTDSTAVRIAAPLPRFTAWRWTLTLRSLRKRSATSNVPSADPSSTTTSCWTHGCRRTRWRTRPRVGASLKAGTITARFASILLQLTPPAKICSRPGDRFGHPEPLSLGHREPCTPGRRDRHSRPLAEFGDAVIPFHRPARLQRGGEHRGRDRGGLRGRSVRRAGVGGHRRRRRQPRHDGSTGCAHLQAPASRPADSFFGKPRL